MKLSRTVFVSPLFLLFSIPAFAHEKAGEIEQGVESVSLESFFTETSLLAIFVALGIVLFFVFLAITFKPASQNLKKLLFLGIVLPIFASTFYLTSSTLYLNIISQSGGPVHWHADFEIWVCGKKADLVDPSGFSNRVGTSTFHEHGDNRIHVEGVVVNRGDASLGNFFKLVGGRLQKDGITLPITGAILHADNGDLCNGKIRGALQVFVYQTKGGKFSQIKLSDPASYVISPYGNVPPGDCVIVEFEAPKERTDRLCNFYKIAIEQGKIHGP